MTTFYVVVSAVAAMIAILGAMFMAFDEGLRDRRAWGALMLAIGIAGVAWGSLNASSIVDEVIPVFEGEVQTVTMGRVVSFEENQLTIVEDVSKSERTTFEIPERIASQMVIREAIRGSGVQTVAVTCVGENVTEVAVVLSGVPISYEMLVDGVETRGGTELWLLVLPVIALLIGLTILLYEYFHLQEEAYITGIIVSVTAIAFLIVSGAVFGLGRVATRGAVYEQYLGGTRGVVVSAQTDSNNVVMAAGSGSEKYEIRLLSRTAREARLHHGDKILYYVNDSKDWSKKETSEYLLLLFN